MHGCATATTQHHTANHGHRAAVQAGAHCSDRKLLQTRLAAVALSSQASTRDVGRVHSSGYTHVFW